MKREIICVSLFNGMGGAFMALEMSGFDVVQKISSEIDKYAIKANDTLFDDTIQIGDVSKIVVVREEGRVVGLMNDKGLEVRFKQGVEILLAGGSPCTDFSFSGKRKGMQTKDKQEVLTLQDYLKLKSEDYEFEGQSYLFWEFVRLRDEIKPKYWFLENVEMGEKWEKVLSKAVGVNGVHINSALLSAQNRKRVYFFNFGMEPMGLFSELGSIVTQPKDKGILLKDVLESDVNEKYYLSDKMLNYLNTRKANFNGGKINYKTGDDVASCISASPGLDISDNIIVDPDRKARCFTAGGNSGGLHSQMDLIVHNTLPRSSKTGKGGTGPLSRNDGKTYCLDTGCTNAIEIKNREVIQLNDSKESGDKQPFQQNRVYDVNGISPALCAFKSDLLIANDVKCVAMRGRNPEDENGEKLSTEQMLEPRDDNKTNCLTTVSKDNLVMATHSSIRRLTPKEAMRLQTVPEHYIDMLLKAGISETQLYRMTGNGWTIEVISYLFNYIK